MGLAKAQSYGGLRGALLALDRTFGAREAAWALKWWVRDNGDLPPCL